MTKQEAMAKLRTQLVKDLAEVADESERLNELEEIADGAVSNTEDMSYVLAAYLGLQDSEALEYVINATVDDPESVLTDYVAVRCE